MAFVDTIARAAFGAVDSLYVAPGLSFADLLFADRSGADLPDRDAAYRRFAAYYDGDQDDPRETEFGGFPRPAASTLKWTAQHNFCSVVVDVMVERLAITGFKVAGEGVSETAASDLSARLWSWWQANRMDETQVSLHAKTLVLGDSYLIADYDAAAGRPRWTYHDALAIAPVYDAHGTLIKAFKAWHEGYEEGGRVRVRHRLTRYTAGLIEKYYRDDNGRWALWPGDLGSDGNPDGGIVLWLDRAGAPLGIPVVHFKNKPRGEDFGRSELADVVPIQDEYNRRVWATSEAMSYQGSPQRFLIDASPPAKVKDTDTKHGGFVSGPGRVWAIVSANRDKQAQAGQFAAGEILPMQDATDRELKTLAAQTRTPAHLLWPDGPLPSGESLKVAEAGLVAKCRDRAIVLGNRWEDAMALGVRLHNTFGGDGPLPEDVTISAQWAPFQTRTELADAQATQIIADDLSREERLRRAGYDAETIEKILEEKAAAEAQLAEIESRAAAPTPRGAEEEGPPAPARP